MNKISNFGIFTLLLVSSLTIMVGTVIAPSLSGIVANRDLSFAPGWLITLPSLGVVLSAQLVGRLLNRLGTLKLMMWGLTPYALLGLAGAFIVNDYLLILDRVLLGVASVAIQVSVTAYIADFFTGETRIRMIAWQGMSIELGGVIFLAIGGVLGELNWQFPFYIYLIALLCLLFVVKSLPDPAEKPLPREGGLIVSGKAAAKMRLILIASGLAMMLFFIGFVTLPLYLPQSFGFSESETGYFLAFISVVAIITASQMPKMVKLLGDGKTVALGFMLFMTGYLILALMSAVPFLILTTIFIGIGFGFTIPLLNYMTVETSNAQNQGKNLGLFSMAVFGGQFLSTFIEYISDNYTAIYSITAALALTISVTMFFLFRRNAAVPE
ncbi:MFS transporter [Neolewinella aurantiaca]|uniref:MFS transporter n=1 Tax=Neolewinella aurantiaca TaxID=2602767 RepID=A0A5C7FAI4_9BACT|nr:MFS transporter [Neolewinella aurantiaca]TXF87810.1 MFS transporter [Neolewinella aurantiaca]